MTRLPIGTLVDVKEDHRSEAWLERHGVVVGHGRDCFGIYTRVAPCSGGPMVEYHRDRLRVSTADENLIAALRGAR